ncbi:MAG: FG-GAP repeat protein, partial [Candidatus Doudnabacteria bacterium]|nr:FG-GAP repeat protein [Candidatus Doudnabacteria bacterium]
MTLAVATNAQVKVGDNPTALDPNAVLEMESTTKGMMLPRMTAAQRDAISNPSNSMLIYNSTEGCINIYSVAETKWKSLCGNDPKGSAEFTADCSSLLVTGTYTTGVALNPSNNYLTVNVDVTTLGSYNILATSAGMYFAASGAFTTLGTQTIILGAQGYPLVSGVNFLALDINGELCTTVITVGNGVAAITGCGTVGAFTGSLVTGQAIADGSVYQSYTAGPAYTGGGVFGITSAVSNGIRISTPVNGTFSASGAPIDYFLTGTPIMPGNTTINYTINGFACSFTVPVQSGTGYASSVSCSGAPAGTYIVGTAMTGSNTKGISLNVTTPGTFTALTNTANGIYFEGTATLAAGAQTMTLTAVGTPTTITPTTYTVTISTTATTFVTCTFTVTPTYPPSVPTFNTLNCASLGMSAIGGVNYVKASNTGISDQFGSTGNGGIGMYTNALSISADGLTMAVGAPFEDGDLTGGAINSTSNNNWGQAGAVYVYTRPNKQSNWSQQAKIKPTQLGISDLFGVAVELSDNGSTMVVGSTGESGSGTGINPAHNNSATNSGAAYVFTRSGSTWSQQAY